MARWRKAARLEVATSCATGACLQKAKRVDPSPSRDQFKSARSTIPEGAKSSFLAVSSRHEATEVTAGKVVKEPTLPSNMPFGHWFGV